MRLASGRGITLLPPLRGLCHFQGIYATLDCSSVDTAFGVRQTDDMNGEDGLQHLHMALLRWDEPPISRHSK